jgi:hypothetical protein
MKTTTMKDIGRIMLLAVGIGVALLCAIIVKVVNVHPEIL